MEDELKQIWQQYDRKLEKSLALNIRLVKEVQLQKAHTELRQLSAIKLAFIVFGIAWLAFIGVLIRYSLTWDKIFFVVSAGIHWIVSAVAVAVYIHHMVLIRQANSSGNVVDTQRKLAALETSSLQIGRLLLVQLPVFVSFQMNPGMFAAPQLTTGIIYTVITAIFTWAGIWLYRNLDYKNADKRWFKTLVSDSMEMAPLRKAATFLKQIDAFEKELA
ncbi:hypothetical protein [uncultured Chitinophaga sp.]|uniref:hypothetical protein n=1 Tax=uncultured Chitinophaga sp. TaxID=339340 RepID=UPI0025ECB645|nr:hypothetical protein [uncultured Chitinophaga sp.]